MHANKIVKLSFEQCMGGSKLNGTARSIWKEQDCQTRLQKNVGGQTSPNTGSCGMPRSRAPSVALGSGGCQIPASRGTASLGGPPGTAPAHPAPERCPCGRWPGPHSAGSAAAGPWAEAVPAGLGCLHSPRWPRGTWLWGGRAPGQGGANRRANVRPRAARHSTGGSHAPLGRPEQVYLPVPIFSPNPLFSCISEKFVWGK